MEPDLPQQCTMSGKIQQPQLSGREVLIGQKKKNLFAQTVFKHLSKLCRMAVEKAPSEIFRS